MDGVTPYLDQDDRETTPDLFLDPLPPLSPTVLPRLDLSGRIRGLEFLEATAESICGIIICPYDTSKNEVLASDVQHATAMFQAFGVPSPRIIINQDRATTLGAIATIPLDCDKLYFYWVGHGTTLGLGFPSGATRPARWADQKLIAQILAGRVKENCVYTDACHSGVMNRFLLEECVDGFHIATTNAVTPTTGFRTATNGVAGSWFTNFFAEAIASGLRGPQAFDWAKDRLQALKDSLAAAPNAELWKKDIEGNHPEAIYVKTFGHFFNFEPIAGEPFCFEIPPGDSTGIITFPGRSSSDTSGSFTLVCETVVGPDTTWKKIGAYHWNLGNIITFRASTDPGTTGKYKMTAHSNKGFFKVHVRWRKEALASYSKPAEKSNSSAMGWIDSSGDEFNALLGRTDSGPRSGPGAGCPGR